MRRNGLMSIARRSPWGMCSTCGLDYEVRKLRYIARFGRWQCSSCDDSDTPPDVDRLPSHPYEAVRTTSAPRVDTWHG